MLSTAATILCLTSVTIAFFFFWIGSFWKRKGVPSKGNIITGVFAKAFRIEKSIGECLKDVYLESKHEKYYGTFALTQPVLIIHDKEIIKQVLLKEYPSFASHGMYYNKSLDHLSSHLFNLAAGDWKFMRTKLTPTFASGKIKYMFSTVQECISTFHKAVDKDRDTMNNVVDIRDLLARLGMDIISSVAFGIEANTVESGDSLFKKFGKAHFEPTFGRFIRLMIRANFKLSKALGMQSSSPKVRKFFTDLITNTVNYREENNVRRNDFLDLLIALKNDDTKTGDDFYDKKITTKDIAAQSFIFFNAGYETTSSAVSFTLFELAKNTEIQKKVQDECDRVMEACGGNVTFEAVQSMAYTEKALQETMRLYPALAYIPRAVTKACKLPSTDVYLEKNAIIWIPTLALHTDDEHFPNPYTYDPERFSEENKRNIPPYSYMPFGDGPRHCIGMRFAMVQMKAVILEIMSRYNVELPDEKRTINTHPCGFITVPKDAVRLKLIPRVK